MFGGMSGGDIQEPIIAALPGRYSAGLGEGPFWNKFPTRAGV